MLSEYHGVMFGAKKKAEVIDDLKSLVPKIQNVIPEIQMSARSATIAFTLVSVVAISALIIAVIALNKTK